MVSDDMLVTVLRRVSRELAGRRSIRDLDETLSQIVVSAVQTVPHVDAGGMSLAEKGRITSRHPSNDVVTQLDRLQSHLEEGPCITALEEPPADGMIFARDLAGDDARRWPRFAPRAVEAGYRSMLSTQLSAEGGTRAALNLYASAPDVFDAESRQVAGLFGVQAAMLLYGSEQAAFLQRAVDTRDVIGQAKGILMERFTVDDDEAFQMLVRSSQDTNMKLVDVAGWLRGEAAARRARRDADLPEPTPVESSPAESS